MENTNSVTGSLNPQKVLMALQSLLESLPAGQVNISGVKASQLKQLRQRIVTTIDALQNLMVKLDPIRLPPHILDPSDPNVVGKLIAETLLVQERHALSGVPRFYGSGVYAVYYSGKFHAYRSISGSETPLYVGKADPATHNAITPIQQGQRLWTRINDHRKSISSATNLRIEDFDCRYLVVRSAWQGTAETYLIDRFLPVWNNEVGICYGFGKHGDDPGTRANTRSPWDTLHPGREWAMRKGNLPYRLSAKQIKALIMKHFKTHPPLRATH